ncbi:hypothetical protein [Streptomyces pini]|uniref:Excreted virulence factor EspC, type VII ESX diderm n=1 Tax=Streptomyces pini TaxID=1520580 RepID=A0A1I3Z3K7_9ACTN|nr:hypothetical protein [Streptomyces pini]SFK38713.1 hypothetical protein SAMN05192584_105311 [Streptomyces pini]
MSFDDEWAQLVAKASQERSAQTRLNRLDGGGGGDGGGQGGLTVKQDDLGLIGRAAHGLHTGLKADGKHPVSAGKSAGTQLSGDNFTSGAALSKVAETWETQVGTLLEACAHISNHLDFSSRSYGAEEEKIETGMRNLQGQLMNPSRISDYYR